MLFRSIEKEDLEQLRTWRNDPRIYQWCRQVGTISKAQQLNWFEKQAVDPSIIMYAIEEYIIPPVGGAKDQIVGVAGLTSIDHLNSRAEFSLYIGPEFQKSGLGGEALAELLEIGFNDLNLNRIWGETFDKNPAIKLFEKIGMQKEGTRKDFYFKGGVYIDAHLYSINKAEYRA